MIECWYQNNTEQINFDFQYKCMSKIKIVVHVIGDLPHLLLQLTSKIQR